MNYKYIVKDNKSLEEAIKNACNNDKPTTILLQKGVYYFENTIQITKALSPIAITANDGQLVEFCGDKVITPKWEKYDTNIYVCKLEPNLNIDMFYVNNNLQIMARYPKFEDDTLFNGFSADCIHKDRVSRWKNPKGGYLRGLHAAEWGGNSYIIKGKDADNNPLLKWVGDNNRGSELHPVKRMVENIFEELTDEKEWFYNKDTGELFYYPESNVDINNALFSITTTESFFSIKNTSNISFNNITFKRTHRTMFTGEYVRPLRGDWAMVQMGVITLENTENVTIKNCIFDDIGGNAIAMVGYNKGHNIDYNEFINIGATAVLVTGLLSAVRDFSSFDTVHKTTIEDYNKGPKTEDYPRLIDITNNYFYNIGVYEKQSSAVCMSISNKITISKNTIHHCARSGININDGTFGGHIIEYNDLFDTVTQTADHGPINAWGRDRFWSLVEYDTMGRFGKEKRPFALLDAVDTTIIRNNRLHGSFAFGVDIDDGGSNYEIYNNLCIGVGIKLREGFDRKAYNNIIIGTTFELHVSYDNNNDLIYSNILCNSKAFNEVCVNDGNTTFISRNIYYNNGEEVSSIPKNDFLSIIADPLFNDFDNNDFSLQENSPCISQGFVPFPISDSDFGRKDKPKPPTYKYISVNTDDTYNFHDVLLSNITDDGIRSAAGLPDYNGVYIAKIDVLGIFCELGIHLGAGDVIREINDVVIKDYNDFVREFENIKPNILTTIKYYRNQAPAKLDYIKQA